MRNTPNACHPVQPVQKNSSTAAASKNITVSKHPHHQRKETMDEIWWKLLMLLNLFVLAVALQVIFELKALLEEVRKALPRTLYKQEEIADRLSKIELSLQLRDKTEDELAREIEWEHRKEKMRRKKTDYSNQLGRL